MSDPTIPLLEEGDLRLPRAPGIFRRYLARHPWVTDSVVVAVYLIVVTFGTITWGVQLGNTRAELIYGIALTSITGAALLFRRYRPRMVLSVTLAATIALIPIGTLLETGISFALYAVAVYRSTRASWIGFAIAVAVTGTTAALNVVVHDGGSLYLAAALLNPLTASSTIVLLVGTLIGVNIGNRKRYVAALVERAGQLARERDQQAQLAALDERSRIAREMHDIVSHNLTVMVTLAEGAAATAPRSTDRAIDAMLAVAETGRGALGDMRRMLGVLHSDDGMPTSDLAPQPGLEQINSLVDSLRSTGLPVSLEVDGEAELDSSEQLTVYRIVQESLTNALRHAVKPTSVGVRIEHSPTGTSVSIVDDGQTRSPRQSTGHGLSGMRERIALFGGSVDAGPRARGGWTVTAQLPRKKRE